jgi:AraC-like DNA-binding protein
MTQFVRLWENDLALVRRARYQIDKNPTRHFTVEELAESLGINRTKLQYGFRQLYGTGIYEYQLQLKMEKAKELLADSGKSVQQVGLAVGYKTKSGFTTAFRKKHGITPVQWRKQHNSSNGARQA